MVDFRALFYYIPMEIKTLEFDLIVSLTLKISSYTSPFKNRIILVQNDCLGYNLLFIIYFTSYIYRETTHLTNKGLELYRWFQT